MDASVFWSVIADYNQSTIYIQIGLIGLLVTGVVISYKTKYKWVLKVVLGILNLFIGTFFFALRGTEPIQRYFALPLYLLCGTLLLWDAFKNRNAELSAPGKIPLGIIILYILYPLISILLGGSFPRMVTHIMPCPVVTISLAIYACYKKKNLLILILLTIWGLTGVKAIIFSAYEDIILLLAGIYGIWLIITEVKNGKEGVNV